MGAVGAIFVVAFLITSIFLVVSFGTDAIFKLLDASGNFFNASQLQIDRNSNEIVCDLIVTTKVKIDQGGLKLPAIDDPKFIVDKDDSHTYIWDNCVAPNNFTGLNVLDDGFGSAPRVTTNSLADAQPNSFFNGLSGSTIVQQIRLIDAIDPTQTVDWVTRPNLSYSTPLSGGFLETPIDISATFVVSNIPLREYNLQIHLNGLDSGINDSAIGVPFTGKVCNAFQTFKDNRCLPF